MPIQPVRDEVMLKVSLLPDSPGVYRYLDSEGTVIYVGKAKNLKRRVSSYFTKIHDSVRTNQLVRHIHDLIYTVVNTEEEALDLENSLIKEFQPRYNVLLKDDKSYPWICVTKEMYPRVFITRDPVTRGAKFYGPYPKTEVAHAIIDTLRKLYPLRTCRHIVSRETIERQKHRLCLQYHIKHCEGCCRGLVSEQQYDEYISQVRQILNGDTRLVSEFLYNQMQELAAQLKFEKAEQVKRKYLQIEKYRARSSIVSPTIHNIDTFALVRDDDAAFINFMHVRNGSIVQSLTLEYRLNPNDEQTDSDLIARAITEVRKRFAETYAADHVREVLVNVPVEVEWGSFVCVIPQRGDKRKLLDISIKNAEQYKSDRLKRMEKLNPEQRTTRTLATIQRDLHLPKMPHRIECFDNSHISGANPVASCVVFVGAKPSKRDYRHFNLKDTPAGDDYAGMREVITRRYTRLVAEGEPLPELIIVDGGKGQLTAAIEALEALGLRESISVVGLAKQLNEVFFAGDSVPYAIDKNSETLRVIQRLRDEAHRFAITFHRKQRTKSQTHSALDDIKGVGPKTKTLLLRHFKSLKRIREASLEEISAVVGQGRAEAILAALNNPEEPLN